MIHTDNKEKNQYKFCYTGWGEMNSERLTEPKAKGKYRAKMKR